MKLAHIYLISIALVFGTFGCSAQIPTGDFYGEGFYLNVAPSGKVYDFKVWQLSDAREPSVKMGLTIKSGEVYQVGSYRLNQLKNEWSLSQGSKRVTLKPFDVKTLKAVAPDPKEIDALLNTYVHKNYFQKIVRGENVECTIKNKGKRKRIKYLGEKATHIKTMMKQIKVQNSTFTVTANTTVSKTYKLNASMEIPKVQTTKTNQWDTPKTTQSVEAILFWPKSVDKTHKASPRLEQVKVDGHPLGSWCVQSIHSGKLIKQVKLP